MFLFGFNLHEPFTSEVHLGMNKIRFWTACLKLCKLHLRDRNAGLPKDGVVCALIAREFASSIKLVEGKFALSSVCLSVRNVLPFHKRNLEVS